MKKDDGPTYLDLLLEEMWSYLLYKKGKAPLSDLDPKVRIRKGIWRDDGLDLTLFNKTLEPTGTLPDPSLLFITDKIELKEGLLRRRKEHIIGRDVRGISDILDRCFEGIGSEEGITGGDPGLLRSNILHPLVLHRSFSTFHYLSGAIKTVRRYQLTPQDISPGRVLKREFGSVDPGTFAEDLKKVYRKKVDKDRRFRTPSGKLLKDLSQVIKFVFTCEEDELRSVITEGSLQTFAEEGLKDKAFGSVLKDMVEDPLGGEETPAGLRIRLGRWLMESPLGDQIADGCVKNLLSRLEGCSKGEASKIEESLSCLMDPRSTGRLTEQIFGMDPERRPHFIRLLGRTGDRAAADTLKRLMEFSTIEEDRKAAMEALYTLGIESGGKK